MVDVAACPSKEALSDYLAGKLDRERRASIVEHVAGCHSCLSHLDQVGQTPDPLLTALRQTPDEDPYTGEKECQEAVERSRQLPCDAEPAQTVGDYELIEELGSGGMATVFRARHTRLDKLVAIKLLPIQSARNAESIGRFEREMRAIGRLEHANIVPAYDAGEVDGRHYLVMELVDGLDLSAIFHRLGPLSPANAAAVSREAALGLQHAHEHGMVHRDMKPSNMMLTSGGKVKILDLGLARLDEPQLADSELTASGQVMGTIDYMAPEQLSSSHDVDYRADIYSLGATLYKLLTGQAPHASAIQSDKPLTKLIAIATGDVTPIAQLRGDIPPPLCSAIDRMLAKDPSERYHSAQEVAEDLATLAAEADLPALYETASQAAAESQRADASIAPTVEGIASALDDTTTEQSPAAKAPLRVAPDGRRVASRKPVAVAVALLMPLILALFGVYYIQMGKATLEVKVEDERAKVVLAEHGLVIVDQETGKTYTLRAVGKESLDAGSYRLRISDDAGLVIDGAESFTINRRGVHIVSIRLAARDKDANRNEPDPSIAKPSKTSASRVDLADDPAQRHRRLAELSIAEGLGVSPVSIRRRYWESIENVDKLPQERFFLTSFGGAARSAEFWRVFAAAAPPIVDLFEVEGSTIDMIAQPDAILDGRIIGKDLTSDDIQKLVAVADLHSLIIGGAGIDNRACTALRQIRELRSLNLSETNITDRGLEELAGHPNLRVLDLGMQYEGLTPRGLRILSTIPHLQYLSFFNLKWLTDADIEVFVGFTNLRVLNVHQTGITAEGADRLRELLPNCLVFDPHWQPSAAEDRFRTWVESKAGTLAPVGQINVGDHPGHVAHFFVKSAEGMERLRDVKGLESFEWEGLRDSDQQLAHVAGLDTVAGIALYDTDLTPAGFQSLAKMSQLESLTVEHAPQLGDEGFSHLRELRHLRNVSFQVAPCTDDGLAHLGSIASLRQIRLGQCTLTGRGMESWAKLPLLHTLRLYQVPITDVAIPYLKQIKSLRILELNETSISAAGAAELQQALPRCVVLHESLEAPGESP